MSVIAFAVHLMGAVMLLLYAVRMVRTGIERAFGASFKRLVTRTRNPFGAAMTGLALAVILQSSAAVGLLVAGFAGAGALGFAAGLSVVLGADLGSALLIQVLSFRLEWLIPVLLAVGGGLFVKTDRRRLKQAGRILLGIAFILISLRLLRETMDPIRSSEVLPAVAAFLENDYFTAFLAGAALALVMHSSVAVVLMCVTLVAIGAFPVAAGVSLVLGANLGSALIPVWLTRTMIPAARRVPLANALVRGAGALAMLVGVNLGPAALAYLGRFGDAQALINVHVLFNLLLLAALPFGKVLQAPVARLLPDLPEAVGGSDPITRSALDAKSLATPQLSLASLKREVLRMAHLVEAMVIPVMDLFREYDPELARSLVARDVLAKTALNDIRHFVAAMPEDPAGRTPKIARDLTEYAIALEAAASLVARLLLPLAKDKGRDRIRFSAPGREELWAMHEHVLANMQLAFNVLISDDLESARLLLEEKYEMTHRERASRKKHLTRLRDGEAVSFDSSDIHLETLRAFREINSHVASVAYPILYRAGQLLETRLIGSIEPEPPNAPQ